MSQSESIRLLVEHLQFMVVDKAKCKSPWLLCPLRDLAEHERVGHTCAKHIGLSLADLRKRLRDDSLVQASCFWSIDAARAAISFLTMNKLSEIILWIQGTDNRIVLEGLVPVESSIGYIATENGIILSNRLRMVFQKLPSSELFGIITAFPIS